MDTGSGNYINEYIVTDDLNLRKIFFVLRKRWYIVFSFLTAFIIIALVYLFFFTKPLYEASAMLFVYRNSENVSSLNNEITAGTQLINDVSIIAKSDPVIDETIKELGSSTDITKQHILQNMSSEIVKNTRLLKISITDKDPVMAARISNAIAQVSIKRFDEIMKAKESENNGFISTVENAAPDYVPVSPNKKLILLGLPMIGLIIGFGCIILIEYFDNTIKSPDEIELHFGSSVIAIIPKF